MCGEEGGEGLQRQTNLEPAWHKGKIDQVGRDPELPAAHDTGPDDPPAERLWERRHPSPLKDTKEAENKRSHRLRFRVQRIMSGTRVIARHPGHRARLDVASIKDCLES